MDRSSGMAIKGRTGKAWLMTVALVIVPWGGILVLLYGAGLLIARKRRLAAVLLLTILPVYGASRMTSAHEVAQVINAPVSLDSHIEDAATRYGVPADLIAAIIETESQFNPRAVSRRGARGLMQLMPATAASLGVGDPFDPRQNIEGGVRHLRSLMDRFDNNLPLVLAAYNAGAQAVINHRGIPPYHQTRQYVKRILRRLDGDGVKTGVQKTARQFSRV
jgi:soluble lytic murein transglycosylase-like protein